MDRKEITADVVRQADEMLALGLDVAMIASRLGITEHIVQVIASDPEREDGRQPRQHFKSHERNPNRGIDAAAIRMIQRMLVAGILRQCEIAREAGVSRHVVERVAAGERLPVSTEQPFVFDDMGETFLSLSGRCGECGAKVAILPCRACRARRNSNLGIRKDSC
jgi:DNA invertase Pin-like site-specific DNA recombinase